MRRRPPFNKLLDLAVAETRSLVCVGLDPDLSLMPKHLKGSASERIIAFNCEIVEATKHLVCAYKPNAAFYAMHGNEGARALRRTVDHVRIYAPHAVIILDAKRGDIGSTNIGYVAEAFEQLMVDGVTVNPYFGKEAVKPFLREKGKGIFILCHSSNRGATEFQNLMVRKRGSKAVEPFYCNVARAVKERWNTYGNCGLVAGATHPDALLRIRRTVGDEMPILGPGFGAQGANVIKAARAGTNYAGERFIAAAGRSIIYASSERHFADAARTETEELRSRINDAISY